VKRTALVLVLTIAVAAGLAAQQTFRAGVDLVNFGIVVTDRSGAPITGLTAADFEIKERGKPQTLKFFSAGDPATAPPLHLGFLLDMSGSMEMDMKDVRTAAIKFLNTMETAVDITLVDFDTEVRVARYGARDYARVIERIRSRKPDGWTAFYDAMCTYLNSVADQTGQKILVVYTDGGDTRSTMTQSDVIELLRASDVTVYSIGYLEHQSSSSKLDQRMQLKRFAEMTGGQAFFPNSLKEVDKMYETIRREISARYSLGYTSTDDKADGAWREVQIRITRPDLKGARIRTRSGYFAPYKPSIP
jgi:Ca-activated chloride channel family protein